MYKRVVGDFVSLLECLIDLDGICVSGCIRIEKLFNTNLSSGRNFHFG